MSTAAPCRNGASSSSMSLWLLAAKKLHMALACTLRKKLGEYSFQTLSVIATGAKHSNVDSLCRFFSNALEPPGLQFITPCLLYTSPSPRDRG